jgi:hypothetical protein
MRNLGEHRSFESESVECAKVIALAISRMGADGETVGGAGDEAAGKELLDDDGVAIQEVFRVIAEREWARSASGTNDTKAIDEQRSWAERERVLRLLGDCGHTNSGGEVPKVIAQRMPVEREWGTSKHLSANSRRRNDLTVLRYYSGRRCTSGGGLQCVFRAAVPHHRLLQRRNTW